MASELQQLIHALQLDPDLQSDGELQRLAQTLQTELHAWEQRPRASIAAPIELTPEQKRTWATFQAFLALLCDYAGWVNRDQWIKLLDVAANIIARGPAGDTPVIGDNGNWWIAGEDTGIFAGGEATININAPLGGDGSGATPLTVTPATNGQIATGTDTVFPVTSAGLRSQLGAEATAANLGTVATTVVPAIAELASTKSPLNNPAFTGTVTIGGTAITGLFAPLSNPAGGQNNYLPINNATVTGTFTLAADAAANLQAVPLQQLNGAISGLSTIYAPLTNPANGQNNYLPIAGPAFTGTLSGPTISTTGNATIGGNLGVTGTTALTGNATFAGSLTGHPWILHGYSFNGTNWSATDTRAAAVQYTVSDVPGQVSAIMRFYVDTSVTPGSLSPTAAMDVRRMDYGAGVLWNTVFVNGTLQATLGQIDSNLTVANNAAINGAETLGLDLGIGVASSNASIFGQALATGYFIWSINLTDTASGTNNQFKISRHPGTGNAAGGTGPLPTDSPFVINWSSGVITTTQTIVQGSDERSKHNIVAADEGMDVVRRISPKRFNRKVSPEITDLGFIAQELRAVLPESVAGDDQLGVKEPALIAVLVNAVKQLDARLAALEHN